MKECSKCKQQKPSNQFSEHKGAKDKLDSMCKQCHKEYYAIWKEANRKEYLVYQQKYGQEHKEERYAWLKQSKEKDPERYRLRDRNIALLKKFGMTYADKLAIRKMQNDKCAICMKIFVSDRDVKVDHDHATGKVRELICNSCNSLLGHARDETRILTNAITYLLKHAIK